VLLASLVAGCASNGDGGSTGVPASLGPASPSASGSGPETLTIHGVVVDSKIQPVFAANVTLPEEKATVQTDVGGRFSFEARPSKIYTVTATAKGFLASTLVARPGQDELKFTLEADPTVRGAYQVQQHFKGHIDCAQDTLIIPGPCGTPVPLPVFTNTSTFGFSIPPAWKTLVLDLSFSPPPTMPEMRMTVRGPKDADQLGDYQQYGRFSDSKSFTARLEPGGSYPDGAGPLPPITDFKVEVYPQGYLYHALDPVGFPNTGVGVATNIEFELVATAFYGAPAPDGYTVRPN
jgi:hypothetical protein